MASNTNNSSGGVDFSSLLAVLFIGLKLTGYISWSWWWVLSPLWISFTILAVFMVIAFIVVFVKEVF